MSIIDCEPCHVHHDHDGDDNEDYDYNDNCKYLYVHPWILYIMSISGFFREQKELPEIHGCQNDRIFKGFSDF